MVEKLLTILLQNGEQALAVIDQQGGIIQHNRQWADQFKASRKTMGTDIGELWPGLELIDDQTVIYSMAAFSNQWKISCQRLDPDRRILFVSQDDKAIESRSKPRKVLAQRELFYECDRQKSRSL
jgi:PAS domain-containing protein